MRVSDASDHQPGGAGGGPPGPHRSTGVPAAGEHETPTFSPTGGPGPGHWQGGTISEPGLDARGGVFFAAIEMTRMPMILTDPNKPDNPIAFANRAFLDLTGYAEEEIIGRNCRFLQGARTNPDHVAELRRAVDEQRAVSVEILNYKRDGTPFWNAVYVAPVFGPGEDRKSTRLNSSHANISYAVFCLKKKTKESIRTATAL